MSPSTNQAPEALQLDIEQFYSSDTDGNQNRSDDLIEDMPYFIKVKIAKHLCRNILSAVVVFQGCGEYFLDALAVHLREGFFAPNQMIFAQDEAPQEFFILQVSLEGV